MNTKKKKLPIQGFLEYVDVIDRKNRVIGKVLLHDIHEKKLPHRTSHILIFNTRRDKLFLQKRGPDVFVYPGYWTSSASGHVGSGQSYRQTAVRELREELGIECDLKYIGYYWLDLEGNNERNAVFVGYSDGPFVFEEEDVPGGKWFDMGYLIGKYRKIKTCPFFRVTFEYYLKKVEG
ncbi:NUDIX domain-containing protein [Patescibacteria group bacterium]|nr:NUDIX domain-containing protein [Patescibacteria group bacterium]